MRKSHLLAMMTLAGALMLFVLQSMNKDRGGDPVSGVRREIEESEMAPRELPPVLPSSQPEVHEDNRRSALDVTQGRDLAALGSGRLHRDPRTLRVTVFDASGQVVPGVYVKFFMGGLLPTEPNASAPGSLGIGGLVPRPIATTRIASESGEISLDQVPAGSLAVQCLGRVVTFPTVDNPFIVEEAWSAGDLQLNVVLDGNLDIHGSIHLAEPGPVTLRLFKLGGLDGQTRGTEVRIASLEAHPSSDWFRFGALGEGEYKLIFLAEGCGLHEIRVRLPEQRTALHVEIFEQVDVFLDVRYRSGRAPNDTDIRLTRVSRDSNSSSSSWGPTRKDAGSRVRRIPSGEPFLLAGEARFSQGDQDPSSGRYEFKDMTPGDYLLNVSPRHTSPGEAPQQPKGVVRVQFPVTIPVGGSALPLLDLLLDEPVEVSLRLSFEDLGDHVLSERLWLMGEFSAGAHEHSGKRSFFRGPLELAAIAAGGELVMDLGPAFPGNYDLRIEFLDHTTAVQRGALRDGILYSLDASASRTGGNLGLTTDSSGATRVIRATTHGPGTEAEPGPELPSPWQALETRVAIKPGELRQELTFEIEAH